jgi:hypothetical protein
MLLPAFAFGQAKKLRDTLQLALDTIKQYRYVPTGVRLGTDVISLAKTQFQDNFSGWEVNADVDFYRYYLAIDYGHWGRNYEYLDTANSAANSSTYANKGNYWRVGVDVNFLKKDPERNMFFIGLRYGRSNFSEQSTVSVYDPVWGQIDRNFTNDDMKARWFELTSGIKVKIWKMMWMGYTARFKFGLKTDKDRAMLAHDVPGYGRTDKESAWGFNYHIMVRIPIRKPIELPELTKKKK